MTPKPAPLSRPLGRIGDVLDPEPPPLDRVQVLGEPLYEPAALEQDAAPIVKPPRVTKGKRTKSRSGSRSKPYVREDGAVMVKEQFSAPEDFDQRWRLVQGLLPRGLDRSTWAVRVLSRAIDTLERQYEQDKAARK
jgi:hypothetical protein